MKFTYYLKNLQSALSHSKIDKKKFKVQTFMKLCHLC